MESSTKERLTGALIFCAAVVIVAPEMILGPDPRPAAIEAEQPAETGPQLRTFSMSLDDPSGVPVAQPVPAATASAPPASAAEARTEPEPEPEPAEAAAPPVPPAVPAPAAAQAAAAEGSWWVQVGLFSSRDNAERLMQKLRAAGIEVHMDKYSSGGKDLNRVRAGPVRGRDEALALQARVKATGNDARLSPP